MLVYKTSVLIVNFLLDNMKYKFCGLFFVLSLACIIFVLH